jgi:hypothetical protein
VHARGVPQVSMKIPYEFHELLEFDAAQKTP